MTARVVIAAIGALFALVVLVALVGLWLCVWGMREPLGFHEGLEDLSTRDQ